MKKIIAKRSGCIAAFLLLASCVCEVEPGPAGPQGAQGVVPSELIQEGFAEAFITGTSSDGSVYTSFLDFRGSKNWENYYEIHNLNNEETKHIAVTITKHYGGQGGLYIDGTISVHIWFDGHDIEDISTAAIDSASVNIYAVKPEQNGIYRLIKGFENDSDIVKNLVYNKDTGILTGAFMIHPNDFTTGYVSTENGKFSAKLSYYLE